MSREVGYSVRGPVAIAAILVPAEASFVGWRPNGHTLLLPHLTLSYTVVRPGLCMCAISCASAPTSSPALPGHSVSRTWCPGILPCTAICLLLSPIHVPRAQLQITTITSLPLSQDIITVLPIDLTQSQRHQPGDWANGFHWGVLACLQAT